MGEPDVRNVLKFFSTVFIIFAPKMSRARKKGKKRNLGRSPAPAVTVVSGWEGPAGIPRLPETLQSLHLPRTPLQLFLSPSPQATGPEIKRGFFN